MPPIAGANSLVSSRMFNAAPSSGRRRDGKAACILNFLMITEHPRELGAGGKRLDGAGDRYRVGRARFNGVPDIDEPLHKRIGHVVATAVALYQVSADARVDHGFELGQMHGD